MKIIPSTRTFSIFIIILFILILFVLFVIVNNAMITGMAGSRVLTDSLFVLLLGLGLVLFYNTRTKQMLTRDGHVTVLSSTNTEPDELTNQVVKEADWVEDEKKVDLDSIIPQNELSFEQYAERLFQNMADEFMIVQGLIYFYQESSDCYTCRAQYAYYSNERPADIKFGEMLPGQAIKNKKTVALHNIPENYFTVASGLGKGSPREIVFVPVIYNGDVVGLIEYATFAIFNQKTERDLNLIADKVAGPLVNLSKKKI